MRSGGHTPSERRVGTLTTVRASDRVATGKPCIGTEGGTRRVPETGASGRTGCRSLPSCRSQKMPVWNVLAPPWPEAITHVWGRTQEIGRGLRPGRCARKALFDTEGRDASFWDDIASAPVQAALGAVTQPAAGPCMSLARSPEASRNSTVAGQQVMAGHARAALRDRGRRYRHQFAKRCAQFRGRLEAIVGLAALRLPGWHVRPGARGSPRPDAATPLLVPCRRAWSTHPPARTA